MINTLETDKNGLPVIGFKQCLIDTLVDCIVNIWVIVATELKKKNTWCLKLTTYLIFMCVQ